MVIQTKKNGNFILGTANFGMDYGVTDDSTELSLDCIEKILDTASKIGVSKIDTAINYGESETKLGKVGINKFDIYSKISDIATLHSSYMCLKATEESIKRLRLKYPLKGMLVHFNDKPNCYDWKIIGHNLKTLKASGLVTNVGISIYSPSILQKISKSLNPEIVQAPFNIFDTRIKRFLNAQKYRKPDIKIIIRSIFLQGILLKNFKSLPNYFHPWKKHFLMWEETQCSNGLSALELAINFAKKSFKYSDIIIGVQNHKQLLDIVNCNVERKINYPKTLLEVHNEDLLVNPYNWK